MWLIASDAQVEMISGEQMLQISGDPAERGSYHFVSRDVS